MMYNRKEPYRKAKDLFSVICFEEMYPSGWRDCTRKRVTTLEPLLYNPLIFRGFCGIIYNWIYFNSLHQLSLFSRDLFGADVADMTRRVIEAVITSCTRNAVVLYWARGFESHTLRQRFTSTSGLATCGLIWFYRFLGKYILSSLLKWVSSLLKMIGCRAKKPNSNSTLCIGVSSLIHWLLWKNRCDRAIPVSASSVRRFAVVILDCCQIRINFLTYT